MATKYSTLISFGFVQKTGHLPPICILQHQWETGDKRWDFYGCPTQRWTRRIWDEHFPEGDPMVKSNGDGSPILTI